MKLKQSRGNNSKSIKARVVLVCDTLSRTVKYHNIPKGIQVMELTRNCI